MIPDFPVRDLKLEAIVRLAIEDWNYPTLHTAKLETVLINFRRNCGRIRLLTLLPTSIVGAATITQRVQDLAELEITGGLLRTGQLKPEDDKKIDQLRIAMLKSIDPTPEGDADAIKYHVDSATALSGFAEGALGASSLLPWLSALVTGTWTTIETMLGDLWEQSLNSHPGTLAALSGSPTRIAHSTKRDTGKAGEKEVPLLLIERHQFEIKDKMGTIFRQQRRFEFTRLSSIREAYSRAFSEKAGKIDRSLGNKSLDRLNAVRNVIVHCGGVADSRYAKECGPLGAPKVQEGKPLRLDGDNVAKLVKEAISSSIGIMVGVDDWLREN